MRSPVTDWSQALCIPDPDMWTSDFSDSSRYRKGMQARAICRTCPLQMPCLEQAVKLKPTTGIWGGYSAHELWRLRHLGISTAQQLYDRPAPAIGRPPKK